MVEVSNNCKRTVKAQINITPEDGSPNINLPLGGFKLQCYGGQYQKPSVCGFLQKVDPSKPFGKLKVDVVIKDGTKVKSSAGPQSGSG